MDFLVFPLLVGFLAMVAVFYLRHIILNRDAGTEEMVRIADLIRSGARAYLNRQFKTVAYFTFSLGAAIFFLLGWKTAVTFVIGSFLSLLAAYIGMTIAVRANSRTAEAARKSSSRAFRMAFLGGSVMGFCVTGLSLIGLYSLYVVFQDPEALIGYGFGASLAAVFAQIGGGIFTKAADIGADLVGKVEMSIPEDDPRNPAVIADLVGDNVGDCAGRGSDLFQSFSSDIITGMILGLAFIPKYGVNALLFPFILQALGVLASMIGVFLARDWRGWSPSRSLNFGLLVTAAFSAAGSYFLSVSLLNDVTVFYAVLSGLIATILALFVSQYYTDVGRRPVRRVAEAAERGVAINIMTGITYGLQSPIFPILIIMAAVAFSYIVSGYSLYAVAAANIGTDLLIGFIMSSDTFGPIVDNANGILTMAKTKEGTEALESLDAVGNTMKASTKAYATTSGTLTAFILFATFFKITGIGILNVSNPFDIAAFFFGVTLTFLFSSFTVGSTTKTALLMVDEVRRQFREIPGLKEGKAKPDYVKCIDISTKNALKEMVFPALVAIIPSVVTGILLGGEILSSLTIGIFASAAILAIFFNNVGAEFDNAKKMIEKGFLGGKGSEAHKTAVIGDTVGDTFKDVTGPSLVIYMKLVGMTVLLLAPFM